MRPFVRRLQCRSRRKCLPASPGGMHASRCVHQSKVCSWHTCPHTFIPLRCKNYVGQGAYLRFCGCLSCLALSAAIGLSCRAPETFCTTLVRQLLCRPDLKRVFYCEMVSFSCLESLFVYSVNFNSLVLCKVHGSSNQKRLFLIDLRNLYTFCDFDINLGLPWPVDFIL